MRRRSYHALKYKEELTSGKRLKEHEEYYQRYFIIKETPKRGLQITFNDEEIQKNRKRYAGFFCILSNAIKTPLTALQVYRVKDAVENSFDALKNHLDMKRLRIHSAVAMDARLFLQFPALIYISQIRNVTQEDKILRNLTVREAMEDMEPWCRSNIPTATANSTPKPIRSSVKLWQPSASPSRHSYIRSEIQVSKSEFMAQQRSSVRTPMAFNISRTVSTGMIRHQPQQNMPCLWSRSFSYDRAS